MIQLLSNRSWIIFWP